MSNALRCVTNGRAAAPPWSSLQHRRLDLEVTRGGERRAHRAEHGCARSLTISRASAFDDQVDVALPDPRFGVGEAVVLVRQRPQALAVSAHESASTDSSPLREVMTSPSTPTWSPRSIVRLPRGERFGDRAGRARSSPGARPCRRGSWRNRACRQLRASTTRPTTPTWSPVAVSGGRSACAARTCGDGRGAREASRVRLDALARAAARASRGAPASARADRRYSRAEGYRLEPGDVTRYCVRTSSATRSTSTTARGRR